jgi:hypothetical protein
MTLEKIHSRFSTFSNNINMHQLILGLCLAVGLIGSLLRLYFYMINRSLWLDEAMLALNIVNRTFVDLFKPLDFNQGAPIGFLLLQKVVISVFGSRDYILRLLPLLAGLISIPLMYLVAKKYIGGILIILPLSLLALSASLIYYSSELKQYSTDVLVFLVMSLISLKCLENNPRPHTFFILAIVGSLFLWFSHPTLFILAGIFLALGLTFIINKDSKHVYWLIGIGVAWGISLGIEYIVNLRYLESNNALLNYWNGQFAPLPIWSNLSWYKNAFANFLKDPTQLPINIITVSLLIIGAFSFAFTKWQYLVLSLSPIFFTLGASALGKYPFSGRLLLFLVPPIFILLAEGVRRVGTFLNRINKSVGWIASACLLVYLLYSPTMLILERVKSPPLNENIKPVMAYLRNNYVDNDLIYIYYSAKPAFEFYAHNYGLDRSKYNVGVSARNNPDKYLEDIDKLIGNSRVWFVFSHNCSWCMVNEEVFITDHLNEIGYKRGEYISDGASVYLYDLGHIP